MDQSTPSDMAAPQTAVIPVEAADVLAPIAIPEQILSLISLPEGPERENLLGYIEISRHALRPQNNLEWLGVIRHGRHNQAVMMMQAILDALQKSDRRAALRKILRPDWRARTVELKSTGKSGVDRAIGEQTAQLVSNSFGEANLDMDPDNDAGIEAMVGKVLASLKLSPTTVEAVAFRIGLADRTTIAQLIAAEEIRRERLEDQYYARRERSRRSETR